MQSSPSSFPVPRSRLNLVTFDHVRHMDLTQGWQRHLSTTDSPASSSSPSSLPSSPSSSAFLSSPSVRARELNVHTVEQLFTSSECSNLLSRTLSQDSLAGEYLSSQRDSTRLLVRCPQLAKVIWDRLLPILPDIVRAHSSSLVPMGFGTSGEWTPYGVNPCMRFSNYLPGSTGFAPHRDAGLVQSTCERSILTVLIYLNDVGVDEDEPEIETKIKPESATTVADSDDEWAEEYPPTHTSTISPNDDTRNRHRGYTSFYRATKAFPEGGVLVKEELPERYFAIQPMAGRAIVFPQDTLHGGDPIAVTAGRISKSVLRTDILFRRYEVVPLVPLELNWRNSAAYLKAVELFQLAFKLELHGKVEQASDCYERCTSLRVAELQSRQLTERIRKIKIAATNSSSSSAGGQSSNGVGMVIGVNGTNRLPQAGNCPAMLLIPDCMRLMFSFLSEKDITHAAVACRTWWRMQPRQNLNKVGITPKLIPAIPLDATFKMKRKYHRNLSVPNMFTKFLPKLHTVSGITCIMSYPQAHYRRYGHACERALAVYAAALFSHRLPSAENLPAHFQPMVRPAPYAKKDTHTQLPTTQSHDLLREKLRKTRIVLSYSPAGEVEWCTFEQLLVAAFRGQEFEINYGSLEQFNGADENPDAASTTLKLQTRVKSFSHGWHSEKPDIIRGRYYRPRTCVSFVGLLPMNYYHAGACCSLNSYSNHHSDRCVELRFITEQRRKKQAIVKKAHEKQDAQELQSWDQNTHQAKWQAIVGKQEAENLLATEGVHSNKSSSSSAAPVSSSASVRSVPERSLPSSSMDLSTVIVQEMRSAHKIMYFRVSFIGIPAL